MRNAVAYARHVLRGIAHQRQFARLEDRVAVIHCRDRQVMQVGGKNQRDAEDRQEISNQ